MAGETEIAVSGGSAEDEGFSGSAEVDIWVESEEMITHGLGDDSTGNDYDIEAETSFAEPPDG